LGRSGNVLLRFWGAKKVKKVEKSDKTLKNDEFHHSLKQIMGTGVSGPEMKEFVVFAIFRFFRCFVGV